MTTMKQKKELIKHDKNKNRMELLPPDVLAATAKIFTFGGIKYRAWDWANAGDWSRAYGALQRHLNLWWAGEDLDKETRQSHLHHAMCELSFLVAWELRNSGNDDRYKLSKEVLDTMSDMTFIEHNEYLKKNKDKK